MTRLKVLVSWLWSENPAEKAISAIGLPVITSSRRAKPTRTRRMYSPTVQPCDARNCRAR
jgi:hypothetical protein